MFTWVQHKGPPAPPKYEKKYIFFIFWVWGVGEKNDKSWSLSFIAFLVITSGFRKEYPHRANIVRDFLANENIARMDPWPACSPDLNPIEHCWDQIGRAVSNRRVLGDTIADLRRHIEEEWANITQAKIQKHETQVSGMHCDQWCGAHTRYWYSFLNPFVITRKAINDKLQLLSFFSPTPHTRWAMILIRVEQYHPKSGAHWSLIHIALQWCLWIMPGLLGGLNIS